MPYEVTPAEDAGNVPESQATFPQFIQFQQAGVNLGGPDIDTVNLTSGVTGTRGVGANANKVTITAAGGGGAGANPTLLLSLVGSTAGAFNGTDFSSWTATELQASADAEWSGGEVQLNTAGVYRVDIAGRVTSSSGSWPSGLGGTWTLFGTNVAESVALARSRYFRYAAGTFIDDTGNFMQWHDTFFVDASTLPESVTPALYATRYSGTVVTASFQAVVSVQRIS